ncbi:alpha/beta fold hydrolase [Aliiglaciecola lipolytica]|uniref:alpha/beta fold hydrolase n=1 Tax=Aliiglaciecola lipolytica TaxID=477689 RepID=UPI001C08DE69|nr:alpha/beta hydrolase [Aliiglaciecola lipolytica]MBU2879252.1 alpha/beta hydrolase [Aliiglaciecola lipolytica]
MQSKLAQIDDCYIHYVEMCDCDAPKGTLIFLHGFPENWRTWRNQMTHFCKHYRVIAPDLPGYNQSSKPNDIEFYQVTNLVEVLSRFVTFVAAGQPVSLIAHDWGGAIAWPLVAFHADLFSSLVILNAAHPSTFTREMISNQVQREKSGYIHQLIASDAIEKVSEDDFRFLKDMFLDENGNSALTPAEILEYQQSWQISGVLDAMLNYYRVMPQLAPVNTNGHASGPVKDTQKMKIPNIRINVPTLVLWGIRDLAFVPEILNGLDDYVPNLKVVRFENANHWLHHQYPQQVNEQIERFLG